MSSDLKLQALLRKFKTVSKEHLGNNKIIKKYQFDISIDDIIETRMFQTKNDPYILTDTLVHVVVSDNRAWSDIPVDDVSPIDTELISSIGKRGLLNNVYNTEFCDESWLINIYLLDIIHFNFIVTNNVHIKSLHIGDISLLSAYNHYINNGATPEVINPEWNWLQTTFRGDTTDKVLYKKYKNNVLRLLDSDIYSVNNINYIINEVSNKLSKINFLTIKYNDINLSTDTTDNEFNKDCKIHNNDLSKIHISHAALIIKLLDNNGIVYMKIPNSGAWDTTFINILLMYSMLFTEVYIYRFNLIDNSTYLVCKNKKRSVMKAHTKNSYTLSYKRIKTLISFHRPSLKMLA